MMSCYDEGQLRAYLDGELPAVERAAAAAHIASCADCRARLAAQHATSAHVRSLLGAPADGPSPRAALARLQDARQGKLAAGSNAHLSPRSRDSKNRQSWRNIMQQPAFWSSRRRSVFGAIAAVVAVLSLLALPPVRAAADELLSIFRVQKVMFVPVSADRLKQLEGLNLNGQTLFVGKPTKSNSAPRSVGSAAAARAETHFAIAEPTLPTAPLNAEYTVGNPGKAEFQINVETARQILQGLGITDVQIPDALGAGPITVEMPALVSARYRGVNYDLTLNQGPSPKVTLPDGVDLAQLGRAALRVLGMTPDQADAASQSIDWSSTLIFPFPADTNNIRQVRVGGSDALLVGAGSRSDRHWQLYWQRGDRFYILESRGAMSEEDTINLLTTTAASIP